jgi:hypothetical protein
VNTLSPEEEAKADDEAKAGAAALLTKSFRCQ